MQIRLALLAIIAGVIVLFFFVQWPRMTPATPVVIVTPGPRPTPSERDNRALAYLGCRAAVEAVLVAPDTARWASQADARIVKMDNGHYAVGSEVTAQNALGVPLRQRWTCEVAVDGDRYTVQLLGLDGEVVYAR